jgi:hypothetical protein
MEWRFFFDRLANAVVGKRAEIEVSSLALGSQVVVSGLPLLGITYDSRSDVLEIFLEGVDHVVRRPRELYVEDPPFGWASLGVIDGDGALQLVRLRDPLMLAPPRTPLG